MTGEGDRFKVTGYRDGPKSAVRSPRCGNVAAAAVPPTESGDRAVAATGDAGETPVLPVNHKRDACATVNQPWHPAHPTTTTSLPRPPLSFGSFSCWS